jgi:hypothetical protein
MENKNDAYLLSGSITFQAKVNSAQVLEDQARLVVSSSGLLQGYATAILLLDEAQYFKLKEPYGAALLLPFPNQVCKRPPTSGDVLDIGVHTVLGTFIIDAVSKGELEQWMK